ncbi:hypothetical protein ABG79_00981 [Caloramator mitchellensis]|uniref:Prolow-density lipoprotein receptor-related protein 1-like beta-propeller domain-containing protein n=1 Tax=Caloramator mitchellensis TaxID=908809 RepID=A0A0R3K4B9_CALMK|nr:hypothetical protein [Caloramator mitchellensis]KRQ87183.1 hypothetical protein ABG79_00981 [Caloramator mitchellensis]
MKKILEVLIIIPILLNMYSAKTEPAFSHNKQNNFIWASYYHVDRQNIYFIDTNDFCIYVSDLDKENKLKLIGDKVDNTGFIYKDGKIIYKKDNGYLYSYDILNKETDKISQYKLVKKYGSFFVLKNDIFYFDELNNLHKVSNGRDLIVMPSEKYVANNIYENQIIIGDSLFTWGEEGINKIDINNFQVEQIYFSRVYFLATYKDKIYFIDEDKRVCSTDLRGENLEIISEDRALDDTGDFTAGKLMIDDNKLYYISYRDNKSDLVRIDLADGQKSLVANNVQDFYVKNDRVIYFTSYEDGEIIMINNDKEKRFYNEDLKYIFILDYKDDQLILLAKSQNLENVFGEIFFLTID